LFSIKRIFGPSPAATASSPEKLLVEAPEIVTLRNMSTDRALWRVATRDLEIGTVIDVGASDGRWSDVCAKHYPDAHYLLIEAQDPHEEALKATSPRIQRLNMSWRLRETRAGKSTSTTVTCSQGSRARYEAKARARSCERPPSTMRSAHLVCLVPI
jgi:FkbM family methyltransferase